MKVQIKLKGERFSRGFSMGCTLYPVLLKEDPSEYRSTTRFWKWVFDNVKTMYR